MFSGGIERNQLDERGYSKIIDQKIKGNFLILHLERMLTAQLGDQNFCLALNKSFFPKVYFFRYGIGLLR